MRVMGVIPARYDSSRFPGKPLALIKGVPLIERVWRRASKSRELDGVIIATDDKRIYDCARGFGADVRMTSRRCASGTDRLAEVARAAGGRPSDIYINVQGDEPMISPALIDALAAALRKDTCIPAVTAACPMKNSRAGLDPNTVKVIMDESGYAIYFSRYPIPFRRSNMPVTFYKHLGIYGYRRKFLLEYASWRPTALERAEQLEQLRIIEKGYKIKVVISRHDSFGVDVPSDIRKVEVKIK